MKNTILLFSFFLSWQPSPPVKKMIPLTHPHLLKEHIISRPMKWNGDYAPAGMNMLTGQPFGMMENTYLLEPASMTVADMEAVNPGTWQFHCHVHDHMMAGMSALYEVG